MRRRPLLTIGVGASACLMLTAGCSTAPATVPLPSTDTQSAIALLSSPRSPGTAPALVPQDELPKIIERYASGELSTEEYRERLRTLEEDGR